MTDLPTSPHVTVVIPYDRHHPNLGLLAGRLTLEPVLASIIFVDYRDQPEPSHQHQTQILTDWTGILAGDQILVARQPRATLADVWNLGAELGRLHASELDVEGVLVMLDPMVIPAPGAISEILAFEAWDRGCIAWLHACDDDPIATMTADGFDGRAFALPADGHPLCGGSTDGLTLDDCARDLLATLDADLNILHIGGLIA